MGATKHKIKRKKLLHELSLLLPAYSYMYEQYKDVLGEKESAQEIQGDTQALLLKTEEILKLLKKAIMKHKKLHKEAMAIANKTFDSLDTRGQSVFLIGLNALLIQSNLKNRVIDIIEIEDLYDLEEMVLQELAASNLDHSNTLELLETFSQIAKRNIH